MNDVWNTLINDLIISEVTEVYQDAVESAACHLVSNDIENVTVESSVRRIAHGAMVQEQESWDTAEVVGDGLLEKILEGLVYSTHNEIQVYQRASERVSEGLVSVVVSDILEEVLMESQNDVCQAQSENKKAIGLVHKEMVNKVVHSEIKVIMKDVWQESAAQEQVANAYISDHVEGIVRSVSNQTLRSLRKHQKQ